MYKSFFFTVGAANTSCPLIFLIFPAKSTSPVPPISFSTYLRLSDPGTISLPLRIWCVVWDLAMRNQGLRTGNATTPGKGWLGGAESTPHVQILVSQKVTGCPLFFTLSSSWQANWGGMYLVVSHVIRKKSFKKVLDKFKICLPFFQSLRKQTKKKSRWKRISLPSPLQHWYWLSSKQQ